MGSGVLGTPLRGLAKTLMNVFGGTATVTKRAQSYDSTTGEMTETETEHTVDAYPYPVEQRHMLNSAVEATDIVFYIPAQDVTMGVSDAGSTTITYQTVSYRVVAVMPVYSGSVIAMYEAIARKG